MFDGKFVFAWVAVFVPWYMFDAIYKWKVLVLADSLVKNRFCSCIPASLPHNLCQAISVLAWLLMRIGLTQIKSRSGSQRATF